MSSQPEPTVKITSIEPCNETKVCIKVELMVDAHRLAEVGGDILSAAAKAAQKKKKYGV